MQIYGNSSLPSTEYPPWVFDYELQTLTRTGHVHLLPGTSDHLGAYYERWGYTLRCANATMGIIRGVADSDSVFHIDAVFENETGIPWSAWIITWRAPFAGGGIPLEDVVHVGGSKLANVDPTGGANLVLTGDPVLPGETFTLNLDVYVGEGWFYDRLDMRPIPEPATVLLLALGSLGLIRTGRSRGAN